jgi:hypothetical protein
MRVPIHVYTLSYYLSGRATSSDSFLGWLNNPNKQTIDLAQVEALPLDPEAKLGSMSWPEVIVPKSQIVAIGLSTPEGSGLLSLPQRAEMAVLYTGRFVVQGYVHPTGDMPINNLFNTTGGTFFPVSQAQIYPLIATRSLGSSNIRLLIVNKGCVHFYHPRA